MGRPARVLLTWGVVGVVLGSLLGLAIGWWLWPVRYTNTAPAVLRRDYRDDYIVMVATAYEMEPELAEGHLLLLDPDDPARPVVELAERLIAASGNSVDIARLVRLASALGASSPTFGPYLGDRP